jgi:hypothetical protein
MDKNLELYLEEQRANTLQLQELVRTLITSIDSQEKVEHVTATVDNQTEPLTSDDFQELKFWLDDFATQLTDTIKENSHKPEKSIKVDNIREAKNETVKISNLDDIKQYFQTLKTAIEKNQPIVNVAKQDVVFPTTARGAIPVRLSDGKQFYKALENLVTSGGGGAGQTDALTDAELRASPLDVQGTFYSTTAQYAVIADDVTTGGVVYVGYADPGTPTSAAGWRIKKIQTSNYPITTWADGNTNFDNVYDNRVSLTYL